MRTNILILFAICGVVLAHPTHRKKRQIFVNPWAQLGQTFANVFSNAFANPFIPVAYPVANTGSHVSTSTGQQQTSSSGYNGYNGYNGYSMQFPFFTVTFPIPWYKGPHVCSEIRYADEPDAFKGFGDVVNFAGSHGSRTESCTDSASSRVCRGRVTEIENGKEVTKQYIQKIQCCDGFDRPNDGSPGCVEREPSAIQPVDINSQAGGAAISQAGTATNSQAGGAAISQAGTATNSQVGAASNSQAVAAVPAQ